MQMSIDLACCEAVLTACAGRLLAISLAASLRTSHQPIIPKGPLDIPMIRAL